MTARCIALIWLNSGSKVLSNGLLARGGDFLAPGVLGVNKILDLIGKS